MDTLLTTDATTTTDPDLRIESYETVDAFLSHAEPFLLAEEARHNLILGLAYQLADGELASPGNPYFSVVFRGDEPVVAALRVPPQNLVLSAVHDVSSLRLLARDVLGHVGALSGINVTGPPDRDGALYVSEWQRLRPGTAAHILRYEQIYELTALHEPTLAAGSIRRATSEDRELLIDWIDAFQKEALNVSDRALVERSVDLRIGTQERPEEGTFLWVDRQPVAMAMASRHTAHGICIRGVWTLPQFRKHGYASSVVSVLSKRMLETGHTACYLYADLANETSNHIYADMGFIPVCQAQHWAFRG